MKKNVAYGKRMTNSVEELWHVAARFFFQTLLAFAKKILVFAKEMLALAQKNFSIQ